MVLFQDLLALIEKRVWKNTYHVVILYIIYIYIVKNLIKIYS